MIRGFWLSLSIVLGVGCASITTSVKVVESPEGTRHIKRAVEGSRTYDAAAEVDGVKLVVTLTKKEICEEADVPVVRRTKVTTNTEAPSNFGIKSEYLAGIGVIVLGALMVSNPEKACNSSDQADNPSTTDPQACSAGGWAAVGIGSLVTTVAVVDSVRASDSEQDLGTHDGEYEATTRECHLGPVANKTVELQLGDNAMSIRGTTSDDGVVSFSMIEVWEAVMPSPSRSPTLLVGEDTVTATLTDKQALDLTTHLLDEPQSRLSHDIADTAQRVCDREVDGAQQARVRADSDDRAVSDARDAWNRARSSCAALWTPDHQTRRENAYKTIRENRIGAIVVALTSGDLDRVENVLTNNPDVIATARDDAGILQLLKKTVAGPARALVSAGKDIGDAQRRLCRSRQIFVRIRGADKWDQFKVEVAKNIVELYGGVSSNIVRLMDAARCE